MAPLDAAVARPVSVVPPRSERAGSVSVRPPNRDEILGYLAPAIRRAVERLGEDLWTRAEEIRLRRERPLSLVTDSGDVWLSSQGLPTSDPASACVVTADDARKTLSLVSQGSVYALEEEFRNGYVTIPGGHRVGLVGRALLEGGHLRTITHVAGLNFRLSREVKGAALPLVTRVLSRTGNGGGNGSGIGGAASGVTAGAAGAGARGANGHRPRSALIVSPPGCGKTTVLRDLIRLLSDGVPDLSLRGFRVGLVDERSEVAACYEGVPQRDVGLRTDVLDACPKAQGVLVLLRSMSPEVIAADEVGRPEDVAALHEAAMAGAAVVATAHGASLDELAARPMLRELLGASLFEVFVVLSRRNGPGTVELVTEGRAWLESRNSLRGGLAAPAVRLPAQGGGSGGGLAEGITRGP